MSCFYTFCTVLFVSIYVAGFLYGLEQEQFYIHSVNVSRTETAQTDRFYLTVLNTRSCINSLQNVASEKVGGSCNLVSTYLGICSFQCRCLENTSSFVMNERKCVDERDFREGCQYVFGSWTWRNGWTWDTKEDPLPILNIESYGITTALNASSRLYQKCEITSIDQYGVEGLWETLDPVIFLATNVVFFKLQGMWHFTWIISEVNSSRRNEIEGRFIRLHMKCSQNSVINDNVLSSDVSSCVVLKITGNITYRYTSNRTTEDRLPTSKMDKSECIFSNKLVLIGFIAGGVLLLLVVVGIAVYCIHGKKFFKCRTAVESESAEKYSCNATEMAEHI